MMVFFVISTHLGGAERSLLDFLQGLKKGSSSFLVVIPKETGPLVNELHSLNIKTQVLPIPEWVLKISRKNGFYNLWIAPAALLFSFFYLFKIHRLVTRQPVQLIHSTGIKFHLLLGIYSLVQKKIPIALHIRDIVHNRGLQKIYWYFSQFGQVEFIANSKATATSLEPIAAKLIYNGFDAQIFRKTPSDIRTKLNISTTAKLVAIVGVIARWKGQREFIEMARMLCNSRNNIQFLIVGDEIYDTRGENGEMNHLKKMVRELGLEKQVHFMGFQKALTPIYSGVDVLVHCSIEPEPFGRVIVEAMLCGCPVSASALGGPLEIVVHERNGLLHRPQNISEIAKNVGRLIDNHTFTNALVQQALIDAQRFSMDTYINDLKSYLDKQINPASI